MKHELTESTLASERLVDGKLLQVYRDAVRLPNGARSEREWIKHPGAAAVVPLFADGTTLLVRQYRYAAGQAVWEVPAGKADGDEDPADVAARELREETGCIAGRMEPLVSLYPAIGYSSEIIHIFLAEDLTEGEQALDDGEFLEVRRLPLAEAVAQARTGGLADMKTVTALLLAAERRLPAS